MLRRESEMQLAVLTKYCSVALGEIQTLNIKWVRFAVRIILRTDPSVIRTENLFGSLLEFEDWIPSNAIHFGGILKNSFRNAKIIRFACKQFFDHKTFTRDLIAFVALRTLHSLLPRMW